MEKRAEIRELIDAQIFKLEFMGDVLGSRNGPLDGDMETRGAGVYFILFDIREALGKAVKMLGEGRAEGQDQAGEEG